MSERRIGDYCPPGNTPASRMRVYYSAELRIRGAAIAVAGVTPDGERYGEKENLDRLESLVCPVSNISFDENGEAATLYLEWHGMVFTHYAPLSQLRQTLAKHAPELVGMFEAAYETSKQWFVFDVETPPESEPVTQRNPNL